MRLTDYEWEERLSYLLVSAKAGRINPVTVMADLSVLFRHVDGEVYSASEKNDMRQSLLSKACDSLNIPVSSVYRLVTEQRKKRN